MNDILPVPPLGGKGGKGGKGTDGARWGKGLPQNLHSIDLAGIPY